VLIYVLAFYSDENFGALTCPAWVPGCIASSQCERCHSSCRQAPSFGRAGSRSCMSDSAGPVCGEEHCTACPDGWYLMPLKVYDDNKQFSEASANAQADRAFKDHAEEWPRMQILYAFFAVIRRPVTGVCVICPGNSSGCAECKIAGPILGANPEQYTKYR
jgi:hypothetical protein